MNEISVTINVRLSPEDRALIERLFSLLGSRPSASDAIIPKTSPPKTAAKTAPTAPTKAKVEDIGSYSASRHTKWTAEAMEILRRDFETPRHPDDIAEEISRIVGVPFSAEAIRAKAKHLGMHRPPLSALNTSKPWSSERRDVIIARWSEPMDTLVEAINALPGPPITAADIRVYGRSRLHLPDRVTVVTEVGSSATSAASASHDNLASLAVPDVAQAADEPTGDVADQPTATLTAATEPTLLQDTAEQRAHTRDPEQQQPTCSWQTGCSGLDDPPPGRDGKIAVPFQHVRAWARKFGITFDGRQMDAVNARRVELRQPPYVLVA